MEALKDQTQMCHSDPRKNTKMIVSALCALLDMEQCKMTIFCPRRSLNFVVVNRVASGSVRNYEGVLKLHERCCWANNFGEKKRPGKQTEGKGKGKKPRKQAQM
jgi:hypothetical protein